MQQKLGTLHSENILIIHEPRFLINKHISDYLKPTYLRSLAISHVSTYTQQMHSQRI